MRTVLTIAAVMIVMWAAPAAAAQRLDHQTPFNAAPRAIAAVPFTQNRVQLLAVTRRARADTPLRRARLYESAAMGKLMTGYPQPAVFSVDIRIQF